MNLIKFLRVICKGDLTPDLVMIEDCGTVDEAYEELCIVYNPQESDADVISIINESKNELADKMLELLKKDPAQLFLMLKPQDKTITDLFVEECGGANAFLDRYEPDPISEKAEQPDVSLAGILHETEIEHGAEAFTETFKDNVGGESTVFQQPVGTIDLSAVESLVKEMNELKESVSRASDTLVNAHERLCNKEESISARFGCMKKALNPDGTFRGFTKENIAEISDSILQLDKEINLGNLDPNEVLSADEVKSAEEYVSDFAPNIFKQFMLSIFASVETEADRVYVSGLLDRFYKYVKENV